ncbi:MAG: bifunctional precorrin-2 dehydrogenase/sirohydrochlorin ferrochelatase [Archaeoglobaceae archaeon]
MRIPIYVEFSGKRVAVIGGGGVGTSRAKKFVEAGAEVTVFSLEFSEELRKMADDGKVNLVKIDASQIDYDSVLSDYHLVVVAIDDRSLNPKIVEAAKRNKTLVNLANDAASTEVVVPFEGEVNGIRFAVTTEGKSGVVAKRVKEVFEEVLRERKDLACFLEVMEFVKNYMKESGVPVGVRMKVYPGLARNEEFISLVSNCRTEEAKKFALKFVEEVASGKRKVEGVIEF